MVMWLKQSTAISVVLGPFVDSTDGNSPETGLTISQADVRLSKNAGAFAQKNSATACSHMENGYYSCPLSTTDVNTLGVLDIAVNESGALAVRHSYMVVTANVWDSYFGADRLQVDVQEIGNNVITTASINDDAFTAAKFAANAFDAATFAADVPFLKAHHTGTAQAGGATSITLAAGASSTTDFYGGSTTNKMLIFLTGGTGAGQANLITAYNGSTKVATVHYTWITNPASGTTYQILPWSAVPGLIGGVTGNLTGNVTGNVNGNLLGNVNGNVLGTLGDLSTTAKASVKTEAVAALNTDTYVELAQGAPPATTTIRRMLQYLYIGFRNKVITDASGSPTTIKHYADDGSTVLFKTSATTVGSVVTRDEHITGP